MTFIDFYILLAWQRQAVSCSGGRWSRLETDISTCHDLSAIYFDRIIFGIDLESAVVQKHALADCCFPRF